MRPRGWLEIRYIDALPTPMHRWAIRAAIGESLGDSCMWRDQALTDMGRNAVAALRGEGVRAMGAPVGVLDKGFWTGAYLCAGQSHVA